MADQASPIPADTRSGLPAPQVLLVTADPSVRDPLVAALESDGFTVQVVANDTTAFALLSAGPQARPQVVLVDPRTCAQGGAAFLRTYRKGQPPHVPIILMVLNTTQAALCPPTAPTDAPAPAETLPGAPFRRDLLMAILRRLVRP